MRRPGGYLHGVGPEGTVDERDTFTCGHCSKVVMVKAGCDPADMGGLCRVCGSLICPKCHGVGTCTPWEKQMEASEARSRLLDAVRTG